MTTQSWASVVDHSGNPGFQAWVAELHTKFAAAGLVQTSDTGQIDTSTVARPSTNSEGGYSIWRFNDAQQSTAPIFIRFGFGTAAAAANPRISVIVGTGSNGSGTITGTALSGALRTFTYGDPPASTATNYNSYCVHAEGFFGLVWKHGAPNGAATRALAGLFITRSFDSAGAPDATGAVLYCMQASGSATNYQVLRFAATAAAGTNQTTGLRWTFIPYGMTNTLVGSDNQVFIHFAPFPKVTALLPLCTYVNSELSQFSTFPATLIGASSHTYLALGASLGQAEEAASANYSLAMLWE